MATANVLPHSPEKDSQCENGEKESSDNDKKQGNSEHTVVSLISKIFPSNETEILPLSVCESVLNEDDSGKSDNNSSSSTKKWHLQVGLSGVYAINNYLYERHKTFNLASGITVIYLTCSKFRNMNCKNGRAVLVIDKDGNKKIRRCCDDEAHNHPPPFDEVVKRNVKLRLKAIVERFPEKTLMALYKQVVKEETLVYSEIDPAFSKLIPKFATVKTYLHRERCRVREERGTFEPKRAIQKETEYATVEVNGTKRSSEFLPIITHANSCRKKIKEEIISSSDDNSCGADDPMTAEVSEGHSDREECFNPPAPNQPAVTNNASFIPRQHIPQQNNGSFGNPTTLQTNNDCALASIVAVSDPNTYTLVGTNQTFCDQLNFQNRFDLLAKNWSEKLKTLRNDQRIFAEKLINDVLFEAELCYLNHGCQIYNPSR